MFIVDKEIINKKYFIESETKTMKETKTTPQQWQKQLLRGMVSS